MFLVMVLNYVDLSAPKPFYPELTFHPRAGSKAATQEEPSRLVDLNEADVLHFSRFVDDDVERCDGRWVRARVAEATDASLLGYEVVLEYCDCTFVGSVTAAD